MSRIALCQFGNETNTFAAGRMEIQNLCPEGWVSGGEVVERFAGTKTYLGGALRAITEAGDTPVGLDLLTMGGNFGAGPLMSAVCVQEALNHICAELAARKDEYDGVFFAVHGGGTAEGIDDLEGYTFQRVREVIGNKPMMSSLDLHGNITPEMLAGSDGLFGIKTVPHLDCYDAGLNAGAALCAHLAGKCTPRMALRRLPMLVTSSAGSTLTGTAKEVMDYVNFYKTEHNLLDATFFHGFSSTDRPCSSASVLVVADGYAPEAEASELAAWIWEKHAGFIAPSYSAAEAVDRALAMVKDGYVVINESSDNPGSGAPGDGTHLLREFLRRDLKRCIMGPMYDPVAAAVCHNHKVGDKFSLELGGHKEPIAGEPLYFDEIELLSLADGKFVSAAPINFGVTMNYGPTARLRAGNVEIIVVSERFQVYDDRSFLMAGAKMEDYSIVGLKSMNHFRGYFGPIADGIIAADTPGLRPADLRSLNYQQVIRPIFPLDDAVTYDGEWPKN